MRCPKCGYVSFDHNESCPKCNKTLSQERERLNLVTFYPDPPFLLGGLLGEVNESGMHYHPTGSGTFKALEEEIELEAETEEVALASNQEEDTEIEIELDSLAEEEFSAASSEPHNTTEAETLTTDYGVTSDEDKITEASDLDSLSGLELEGSESEIQEMDEAAEPQAVEPLVFEMEDITLEGQSKEELDLELIEDETAEAPTEVHGTAIGEQELILEDEPSVVEEIEELSEDVLPDQTEAITSQLAEAEEAITPVADGEPTISLEDLKDDDLGEVDVEIDDVEQPTQKLADGHGG